jgi:hypothetical protein
LELFLKLKATISGNGFLSIDYFIFHKIEYITSINLGHGVKFFKSFLYTENASPKQYDKLVLIPSKKYKCCFEIWMERRKHNKNMLTQMG